MSDELLRNINEADGWVREMGIVIRSATEDEVVADWTVEKKHLQAYGIVHGGVYCGVIETIASVGAAIVARPRNQRVVGLENTTSFIRAVHQGHLRAIARPVTRGRTTQVWAVDVLDDDDKLVANGQVRVLCIAEDRAL